MAARTKRGTLDKPWDDGVRAKIKTSMLLNRLTDHAFDKVKMSSTQVTAAIAVLRKSLPDLSSEDVNIKGGGPLVIQLVRFADADRSDPK
jgi:hypothetical protein